MYLSEVTFERLLTKPMVYSIKKIEYLMDNSYFIQDNFYILNPRVIKEETKFSQDIVYNLFPSYPRLSALSLNIGIYYLQEQKNILKIRGTLLANNPKCWDTQDESDALYKVVLEKFANNLTDIVNE